MRLIDLRGESMVENDKEIEETGISIEEELRVKEERITTLSRELEETESVLESVRDSVRDNDEQMNQVTSLATAQEEAAAILLAQVEVITAENELLRKQMNAQREAQDDQMHKMNQAFQEQIDRMQFQPPQVVVDKCPSTSFGNDSINITTETEKNGLAKVRNDDAAVGWFTLCAC